MRRRFPVLPPFLPAVLLLPAALAAQQPARPVSDAEVRNFLELAAFQARLESAGRQAARGIAGEQEAAERLGRDVHAGRVDPAEWLARRGVLGELPAAAQYAEACSRSQGAMPAFAPEDALRSDLASPIAVFVLPWPGPRVRVRTFDLSNPDRPDPEGHAAWQKLRAQKRAAHAELVRLGWLPVVELDGTYYLVSRDTTAMASVSSDAGVTDECQAVGGGWYTGPAIAVQAIRRPPPDAGETWREQLERVGWDETRYQEVFFNLRLARQFRLGSEEVEIWRAGGVIPPATNLALYGRYAARLDALLARFDRPGG